MDLRVLWLSVAWYLAFKAFRHYITYSLPLPDRVKKKNGLLCYRLSGSYLFGRKRMYSKEILMDSAGISNRTLYTFITDLICEMFVNYVAYCRRFPCHFFCTYIPPKHKTHGHLQKKIANFRQCIYHRACTETSEKYWWKRSASCIVYFLQILPSLRSTQVCSLLCTPSNWVCCFFNMWQDADCTKA